MARSSVRSSGSPRSILALAVVLVSVGGCASIWPFAGGQEASVSVGEPSGAEDEDGIEAFSDVVPDTAASFEGLFTVHRAGEDYWFEIPDSLLGREILWVVRTARTPTDLSFGGGVKAQTHVVRWERRREKVFLRSVSYENFAPDSLPIYEAVRNANVEPIVRSFPIEAYNRDTTGVVLETGDLFTSDVKILGLGSGTRSNYGVTGVDGARSYVDRMESFPRNVEVHNVLTYQASDPPSNEATETMTVEFNHSIVLLPREPMQPRLCDDRVGYFNVERTNYGLDSQKAEEQCFVTRWKLQPADTAAFRRGEPVEPVEPIVYYVDPATPEKWRPYIKRGIEDWNQAFRAAGFENAIRAADPPSEEENPRFDPDDVRYSVVRWFPSEVENAYGPHVHDPRSGQILESDIGFFHNVMNLLRNWYFVQTAAINPEARHLEFDKEVMGRLIRFVAAHEVGHTLGLPHNMKASSAYPVDSLRSPSFTQEMGTAPSIMDYARFNYVAQPEDGDVGLMPDVGPYDEWAIRWGYRPVPGYEDPRAEREALDEWVVARQDDPIYRFGGPSQLDPTSQTEDLGANSMEAGRYGIENLKHIVPRLVDWIGDEGREFDELEELYQEVGDQFRRYVGHVRTNVGGVYRQEKTFAQDGPVYEVVPEERQRDAVHFLNEQVFDPPTWLLEEEILSRIGDPGSVERIRSLQVPILNGLLDPQRMQRLIESERKLGGEAYSLEEMLADLRSGVWSELDTSGPIGVHRRVLQRAYLERMAYLMTEEVEIDPQAIVFFGEFTPVNVAQSDIRPLVRGELRVLESAVEERIGRTDHRMSRLHLEDVAERIDRILRPREEPEQE